MGGKGRKVLFTNYTYSILWGVLKFWEFTRNLQNKSRFYGTKIGTKSEWVKEKRRIFNILMDAHTQINWKE